MPSEILWQSIELKINFSVLLCISLSVSGAEDIGLFEPGEENPGGTTSHHFKQDRNSFSHASQNLNFEQELNFKVGNALFQRVWVSSPSSTQAVDGLGPLFNSRSCQRCHIKDGRGHPPLQNEKSSESFLLKLSIPPETREQKAEIKSGKRLVIPDPVYGAQLQTSSVQGVKAEGEVKITYEDFHLILKGNQKVILNKPVYSVANLQYGPLHPQLRISPRVAPQMIGLGLIEAISEDQVLSNADPDDLNNDGISGRPNTVWSREKNRFAVGRFGHKAGVATLNEQNQNAFSADIGISTPLNTNPAGDCTKAQTDCLNAHHGNSPQYDNLEVHNELVELILFYTRNLAVPARPKAKNPDVLIGKKLFNDIGCQACHRANYLTESLADRPEHSNQSIWPYSDFLLHDLGQGLADNSTEGLATGQEWRTAPLWGIGLTQIVNGHTRYLHDGRAHNLDEAILWHGGEAMQVRDRYLSLTQSDRQLVLEFVNSL